MKNNSATSIVVCEDGTTNGNTFIGVPICCVKRTLKVYIYFLQQKVTNNSYRKMTLYNSNEHCKLQHSTLLCVNTLSGPLITATVISSHTDCILYLFNTAGSVKWVAMDCMIWVRLLAAAQICIPTTTSTSALQFAQLSIQQYLYHVLMYTSTRLKVETNDSSLSSANI